MEKLRYRLVMYKLGKYFLAQSFDDFNLAIKQGRYFRNAELYDHMQRGFAIIDTLQHDIIIAAEGDTPYEDL